SSRDIFASAGNTTAEMRDRLHGGATLWVPTALAVAALGLVPWTFVYIAAQPARYVTRHWDLVWVGFDLAVAMTLATTALAAAYVRTWLPVSAAASAT